MVLSWLGRLQGLFAAWVLLFLVSSLVFAASHSFSVMRERYRAPEFVGKNGRPVIITSLFEAKDLPNRSVLLLDGPQDADLGQGVDPDVLDRLEQALQKKGMRVRRSRGADALPLAQGMDVVVLATPLDAYLAIDFAELHRRMRSPHVLDFTGAWDGSRADAAGVLVQGFTRTYWPAWLDPELASFLDHLRETIAPEEGVLLVPGGHLSTTSARARWYLMLNERLSPRRFYMRNPAQGTSYVPEYFAWVQEYNQHRPWASSQRILPQQRSLSGIPNRVPTRTLTSEEIAAAQGRDIQWVLFWAHSSNFNTSNWELVALDTVLSWSQGGSR